MFKELFLETSKAWKLRQSRETIFEIINIDNNEILFTSRAGNAADQVDRKLKQKKYQKLNVKVMRTSYDGAYQDVSTLFEAKAQFKGGPDDNQSKTRVETLINSYDWYVSRIDDYPTLQRARSLNIQIVKELKELGVTEFNFGSNKMKI